MPTKRVKVIVLLLAALLIGPAFGANKEFWRGPFFWQKKEIQERMRVQKYIPVSVTSTQDDGKTVWWMKGAGILQAPIDFTFAFAKDFSKLEKMTSYFDHVEWDKAKNQLTLVPKVFTKVTSVKMEFWETHD